MASYQVSRDPFARTTLMREVVKTSSTCAWCGGTRKQGGSLFSYKTVSDGGRSSGNNKLFCSRSCYDTYYE